MLERVKMLERQKRENDAEMADVKEEDKDDEAESEEVDANKSNQADLRQDFGFRIADCAGCCAECVPYAKCQYCKGNPKCDNECRNLNREKLHDCIVLWRKRNCDS